MIASQPVDRREGLQIATDQQKHKLDLTNNHIVNLKKHMEGNRQRVCVPCWCDFPN